MTDPARLEALEMRIAHLERAVQELSEEFYRQQRDIDRLRQRNQQLLAEIEGGAAGGKSGGKSGFGHAGSPARFRRSWQLAFRVPDA